MAMGTVTATNLSGGTGNVQFQEKGDFTQIRKMALTTSLASGDVIIGPSIPADCTLVDVSVDVSDIDTDGTPLVAFTVGITGTAAKFITTSAAGTTGGIERMNAVGCLGYTPTADTPVLVTMTASAATAAAGTMYIAVTCTRNP